MLPLGTTLKERYLVGRLLGRGGFGATYAAWDTSLRVRVAIKEFLPRDIAARVPGSAELRALAGYEDAFQTGLTQFLEEARNLAQFRDHASIISVLDYFYANGTVYMVMEYLDGETLEQHAGPHGRIEPVHALGLMWRVADALRAVHAIGMIHRDVSPDNIILTQDGRVKLFDFGAARYSVEGREASLTVIYKPGYAPAEQYQQDGRQLPSTDIYAWTATLYRLVTGDLPPPAPQRLSGAKLAPATRTGIKLPPGLEALLERGLNLDPRARYQSIDALQADIQAVLGGDGMVAPPRKPGWRRWAIGGGAALVSVFVASVLAYQRWPATERVPPSLPDPMVRPVHATISGVNPIDQARHQIVAALRDMGRLSADLGRRRTYARTLAGLRANPAHDASIDRAIDTQEYLLQSVKRSIQNDLASYSSDVQSLAAIETSEVSSAIDLERQDSTTAHLRILQDHVVQCRDGKLSTDQLEHDLDRTGSGGGGQ